MKNFHMFYTSVFVFDETLIQVAKGPVLNVRQQVHRSSEMTKYTMSRDTVVVVRLRTLTAKFIQSAEYRSKFCSPSLAHEMLTSSSE